MTPEQVNSAIRGLVGDVEITGVQAFMIGPYFAEVKVRRASDGEWFQGVMKIEEEP